MEFSTKIHVFLVFVAITSTFLIGHSHGFVVNVKNIRQDRDQRVLLLPKVKNGDGIRAYDAKTGVFTVPYYGSYYMKLRVVGFCMKDTEMAVEILRQRDSKVYTRGIMYNFFTDFEVESKTDKLKVGDKFVITTNITGSQNPKSCYVDHAEFHVTKTE